MTRTNWARLFISSALISGSLLSAQQKELSAPPEAHSPLTLSAVFDPAEGHNAFAYAGKTVPPVIRVSPGGVIKLDYENRLPAVSNEKCALAQCMNMSNLHFHGLHVSPSSPQDDVLTMMSNPGEVLHYRVDVPSDAPPGLYWYHTHPHGESARQALDGMSGAIVIEGIDRYYPQLRKLPERVLILRDRALKSDEDSRERIVRQVGISADRCGTSPEQHLERVFTLNGELRPQISMRSGGRELWRIVNASPDLFADLQLEGQSFEIVALDGMPLSYHDPKRRARTVDHILVPPAGRVEAIVTGPASGTHSTFSTRCVDTGADGDPNPAMVIADVTSSASATPSLHRIPTTTGAAVHKEISSQRLAKLEAGTPDFTVVFTEDNGGFYINGKKFSMDAAPMLRAHIGSMQHWRIENASRELHPFHIHQVHFLAYATNGIRSETPEWLDTVNVPYGGSVDLIMDFTDPVIRGMSLFHCHILSHEDKGMMAKILFE